MTRFVTFFLTFTLLAAVRPQGGYAQVWSQATLWYDSPLQLNPAGAGGLYSVDAALSYRKQWVGLSGAPETAKFYLGAPLYRIRSGVALGLTHDAIGAGRRTGLHAAYAYNLLHGEELDLSVGLGLSYWQYTTDGAAYRTATGDYEGTIVDHRDELLTTLEVSRRRLSASAGVQLRWRQTYVGASLLDYKLRRSEGESAKKSLATYTLSARTLVPLLERIEVEAFGLAYGSARIIQSVAAARFWYDGNIGLGASLRGYGPKSLSAVSGLLAWRASESITVSYAYDFGLSELAQVQGGSHEVVVRYQMGTPIGKGRLPPTIFHPRP